MMAWISFSSFGFIAESFAGFLDLEEVLLNDFGSRCVVSDCDPQDVIVLEDSGRHEALGDIFCFLAQGPSQLIVWDAIFITKLETDQAIVQGAEHLEYSTVLD